MRWCFGAFLFGLCLGVIVSEYVHKDTLNEVGIKYIKKCEVDTPNCHSNWYEIVWKDGARKWAKEEKLKP